MATILVVDDEVKMGVLVAGTLEDAGYEVTRTDKGERALTLLSRQRFDVVITDLKMSPITGLTILNETKKRSPETAVILMTAHATAETAVQAMKAGAADYLIKPFSLDELTLLVERQLAGRRLKDKAEVLARDLARYAPSEILGKSAPLANVLSMVDKVARTNAGVLITGESGSGKELVARAIHAASPRRDGPFVAINCAALPETLLESELFGHEKGAFTGAVARKRGRFELADGGTLFLDEVGEIALGVQVKLLRALEEHAFVHVGGTSPISVDVRVVAATNRDLLSEMRAGRFREDLFFRLNVVPLEIAPLRDRPEDIVPLAEGFADFFGARHGRTGARLTDAAKRALVEREWPGNVREL
ncbi:MAG TPA: sigma-54 dependent transcriptional regulator, partial [Gemmatimonadota bacterium]|nr:sigma-54 dependent transcriptional regulator [Gemmatimonadota bacterium]